MDKKTTGNIQVGLSLRSLGWELVLFVYNLDLCLFK